MSAEPSHVDELHKNGYQWTALPCEVGPLAMKLPQRPCKMYHQLNFERPAPLRCIMFRNYHTAWITIKQYINKSSEPAEAGADGKSVSPSSSKSTFKAGWRTILHAFQLMEDAHSAGDAQIYHTIDISQFNDKYDPADVRKLRIYLYQPSPLWKSIGIRKIACYSRGGDAAPSPKARATDASLVSEEDKITERVEDMMKSWRGVFS